MTPRDWQATTAGVFLVTNIAPVLSVTSLIRLPFGLSQTISCMGPVYEPAMALCVKGQPISLYTVLGSMLAVLGVALLCL